MSIADNLHTLGVLMKNNLEEKGVGNLTGEEGLTTLANKILDINNDSNKKTPSNNIYTSANDKFFLKNNQLTIYGKLDKVESINSVIVNTKLQNASIKIYNDDNLLGNCNTNSDGNYSFNYTPLNSGRYSFKGVFEGVDIFNNVDSNTVNITVVNSIDVEDESLADTDGNQVSIGVNLGKIFRFDNFQLDGEGYFKIYDNHNQIGMYFDETGVTIYEFENISQYDIDYIDEVIMEFPNYSYNYFRIYVNEELLWEYENINVDTLFLNWESILDTCNYTVYSI